jgi:peptide/nickel transport system permease protein
LWKYIYKRIFQLIPILLGITFLTFSLLYIAPTDPATMKLSNQGIVITNELLEQTRIEMGLDKPFLVQYFTWIWNALQGDFGLSFSDNLPVMEKVLIALPATVALTVASILTTIIFSIPIGIYTAVNQNKLSDYIIRFFSFIGAAIPQFLLAIYLIYFFALQFKLLPVLATGTTKGLLLPTVSLAIPMICKYVRQVRSVVLDELDKDYVTGARSRGVKERIILYKNVLLNSMITIVTLIALSIGSLLGGATIVEQIFVWPGIGKMAIDAINARDIPVIQGFVVWMAIIYVVINLLSDIIYWLLNPKIRVWQ